MSSRVNKGKPIPNHFWKMTLCLSVCTPDPQKVYYVLFQHFLLFFYQLMFKFQVPAKPLHEGYLTNVLAKFIFEKNTLCEILPKVFICGT